ncbi:MAG: hypothetical protein JW786_11870 [Desulfobacterales bacterium]|nr:hypothetical protein [Desulfobacterales bacterium]
MQSFLSKGLTKLFVMVLFVFNVSATNATLLEYIISNADILLSTDPLNNTITDIEGVVGTEGRKIRIDSFHLSMLSGPLNRGIYDSYTNTIEFSVDLKADYVFLDNETGDEIQTDSFSFLFNESGILDSFTQYAMLDGSGPARENEDTVFAGWIKNLIKELASGTTLVYFPVDDLLNYGTALAQYQGSLISDFYEISIDVAPEFGGDTICGRLTGEITLAVIPEPSSVWLIACGFAFLIRQRINKKEISIDNRLVV